ncbi:DMT family transporter [Psychromonas hadalis]|uniref:DMT family transporter n=1 Tax=Psychromonas hadalis TaxID=211669 RepID=UPI0003B33C09|nr:DMT family transporter [Psychromonas hadalis]
MFNNLLSYFSPSMRFMLLSAFAFSLMTACVKLVATHNIPVFEIIAARAFVSLVISYLDIKRKKIALWGNNKKLLMARGIIGTLALICIYYAVTTLPLAEATLLQYTYPVFTAVLAFFFLKEKIQRSTLICIILSLLGLVVMVMPNLSTSSNIVLPWFSVFVALLGALGSAIAYVIVKRLSQSEDSSVIIFYFPLIALPLSIILLGDDFVMPNGEALMLLLFVGIFTQVGQVGLTKAMQSEVATKVSAFSYIQVVFSIIFGLIIFNEVPSVWTLSGGLLIVIGALINLFANRRG